MNLIDEKNKTNVTYEFTVVGYDAEELYAKAERRANEFFASGIEYQLHIDAHETKHAAVEEPYTAHCRATRRVRYDLDG